MPGVPSDGFAGGTATHALPVQGGLQDLHGSDLVDDRTASLPLLPPVAQHTLGRHGGESFVDEPHRDRVESLCQPPSIGPDLGCGWTLTSGQ